MILVISLTHSLSSILELQYVRLNRSFSKESTSANYVSPQLSPSGRWTSANFYLEITRYRCVYGPRHTPLYHQQ